MAEVVSLKQLKRAQDILQGLSTRGLQRLRNHVLEAIAVSAAAI